MMNTDEDDLANHRSILHFLQIRLTPPSDPSKPSSVPVLSTTSQELINAGYPASSDGGCLLTTQTMEVFLVDRLHITGDAASFLYDAWRRATDKLKQTPSGSRHAVLQSCITLVVSYIALNASEDVFKNTLPIGGRLARYLVGESIVTAAAAAATPPANLNPIMAALSPATVSSTSSASASASSSASFSSSPQSSPMESNCLPTADALIVQLLATRQEEEDVAKLFLPTALYIGSAVAKMSLVDEWKAAAQVLSLLGSKEAIVNQMIKSPQWVPPPPRDAKHLNGRKIEEETFLGPYFGASIAKPSARMVFLPLDQEGNVDPKIRWDVSTFHTCRMYWRQLAGFIRSICLDCFLTKKPQAFRDALLQWFAAALNTNRSRKKTQVDYRTVCSDFFMMTFVEVMLALVEPVIVNDQKMKDKIVASYVLSPSSKIQYGEFTRLTMDSSAVKEAVGERPPAQAAFGFVTEIFFFTYHALYLGVMGSLAHLETIGLEMKELKAALQQPPGADPALNPLFHQIQQKAMQARLNELMGQKFEIMALFYEPDFAQKVLRFVNYASLWLLRTIFGNLELVFSDELPAKPPVEYAAAPEYFLEVLADILLNYLRRGYEHKIMLHELVLDHFITLIVLLMPRADYIKNPYIRAKFPEILYMISMIDRNASRGGGMQMGLGGIFLRHNALIERLIPALVVVYVDVENLGGHNQFYEKFTPRYYIAELFKYLWNLPAYKMALEQEAQEKLQSSAGQTQFVKFFNYLLNDANFLLQESIGALKEMHDYEELKENAAEWNKLEKTVQAEKTDAYTKTQGRCRSFMQFANESVGMMEYMSKDMPKVFLRPELIDRVAAMLNYFLMALAGKTIKDLKVANATSYNFNHKTLIEQIVHTYLNFARVGKFHRAVVEDGRSYSPENFDSALRLIANKGILLSSDLERFAQLCETFARKYGTAQQDDMIYEDFPEEFGDPVLGVLMQDPVKLPASGVFMDRPTITRHLLNDDTDPFNRAKLTLTMLNEHNEQPEIKQEIEELRSKIAAWKESKRQAASSGAPMEVDH